MGLTVIAASVYSLFLRPTCNHNHKVLASASAEIKRSAFWWYQRFANFEVTWPPTGGEIRKSGSEKDVDHVPYNRNQPSVLRATPK